MDLLNNSFFAFIIINICLLFGTSEADLIHRRRPRAIWTLGAMVECVTTRSAWDFNKYGCWCGFGGEGTPVDDVDRCCRAHDECYDALVDDGSCSRFSLYVSAYLYERRHCDEVDRATITCAGDLGSGCGAGLCHCDREAALCFAKAKYNPKYSDHDRNTCLP